MVLHTGTGSYQKWVVYYNDIDSFVAIANLQLKDLNIR